MTTASRPPPRLVAAGYYASSHMALCRGYPAPRGLGMDELDPRVPEPPLSWRERRAERRRLRAVRRERSRVQRARKKAHKKDSKGKQDKKGKKR